MEASARYSFLQQQYGPLDANSVKQRQQAGSSDNSESANVLFVASLTRVSVRCEAGSLSYVTGFFH